MYAIFEAGGRQHRAETGKVVKMDKVEAQVGDVVEFDKVLALFGDSDSTVGAPYVAGAKVVGRVIQQGRDRKFIVFKYRLKSGYKRTRGHRQHFTQVEITDISV
jgi:large subunit ribosomal protein L21